MFPKKAVASVTGIGGMSGAFGGILIAWAAGLLLKHFTALGTVEKDMEFYLSCVVLAT